MLYVDLRVCMQGVSPWYCRILQGKPTAHKVITWRRRDAGLCASPLVARKLRIEYPGAVYHIINRGDRREAIFQDDTDRHRFLQTLRPDPAQCDLCL